MSEDVFCLVPKKVSVVALDISPATPCLSFGTSGSIFTSLFSIVPLIEQRSFVIMLCDFYFHGLLSPLEPSQVSAILLLFPWKLLISSQEDADLSMYWIWYLLQVPHY